MPLAGIGITRIGEGYVNLTNLGPSESVKFETTLTTAGNPASLSLMPRSLPNELGQYLPPNTIAITVNSVPQGAELKIDGQPAGTTPKIVQVSPGKHILEFNKEGFNTGTFPLEVAANDANLTAFGSLDGNAVLSRAVDPCFHTLLA